MAVSQILTTRWAAEYLDNLEESEEVGKASGRYHKRKRTGKLGFSRPIEDIILENEAILDNAARLRALSLLGRPRNVRGRGRKQVDSN